MSNHQEGKEYTIERLSKSNLKDIENLFNAVYGFSPSKDYLYKKYDTAYTGVEYVGFIAYNKEHMPIAYCAVIPCFLHYGDKLILGAQCADAMTHPMFRYKGLSHELSILTFSLSRTEGIRLVFGFPNQNFYNAFIHKLGWQSVEKMDYFKIEVNAVPLEAIARRFKWLMHVYKRFVKKKLFRFVLPNQLIASSIITDGYAGVKRDAAYFKYKTYSDTHVIEIAGARLWIKIKNGFIIGEIQMNGNDLMSVIKDVKKLSRQLGTRKIYFHSSPGTRLHSLFTQHFKPFDSFPVILLDLDSGIPVEKIKFTFADIDIF